MKILITGGAGFIGSAVIRLAIARGHSVVNIDAITYAACLQNITSVEKNPNYSFEKIDIRNRKLLDDVFARYSPDAVMHLAAETHVDRSIENPTNFIDTNVNGTLNLLEAALHYWRNNNKFTTFRFHHVSTDEVIGSLPSDPRIMFTEETPYNPQNPYSASKASSDHLVRAWHSTYGLPVVLSNCSNNYGPYQFPEKLLPVIILNAFETKPLPLYGNGKNIRDWLYVDDHADALLLVLTEGAVGRSYNIGAENEWTNLELVRKVCAIFDCLKPRTNGSYMELITFVKDRPGHDSRYAINPSRIQNELNWRPSITLDVGLKKTISWYIDNEDWWRPLLLRSRAVNT